MNTFIHKTTGHRVDNVGNPQFITTDIGSVINPTFNSGLTDSNTVNIQQEATQYNLYSSTDWQIVNDDAMVQSQQEYNQALIDNNGDTSYVGGQSYNTMKNIQEANSRGAIYNEEDYNDLNSIDKRKLNLREDVALAKLAESYQANLAESQQSYPPTDDSQISWTDMEGNVHTYSRSIIGEGRNILQNADNESVLVANRIENTTGSFRGIPKTTMSSNTTTEYIVEEGSDEEIALQSDPGVVSETMNDDGTVTYIVKRPGIGDGTNTVTTIDTMTSIPAPGIYNSIPPEQLPPALISTIENQGVAGDTRSLQDKIIDHFSDEEKLKQENETWTETETRHAEEKEVTILANTSHITNLMIDTMKLNRADHPNVSDAKFLEMQTAVNKLRNNYVNGFLEDYPELLTDENSDIDYAELEKIVGPEVMQEYKEMVQSLANFIKTGKTDTELIVPIILDQSLEDAERARIEMEADADLYQDVSGSAEALDMELAIDTAKEIQLEKNRKSIVTPNWYTSVDSPTYHITLYLVTTDIFSDPAAFLSGDANNGDSAVLGQTLDNAFGDQGSGIDTGEEMTPVASFGDGSTAGYMVSNQQQKKAIIIAESGVTSSFMIDNLDMEHKQSVPSSQGSSSTAVIAFDIFEPGGFELMNKILKVASIFGYSTMANAQYVLKIEFMGLDPANGEQVGYPKLAPQNKRIPREIYYPITMTHINSDTDEGGTKYDITAATINSKAQYLRRETSLHLTGITTVGSLLDKLQDALNGYEKKRLGKVEGTPDVWAIRFDITPTSIEYLPEHIKTNYVNLIKNDFLTSKYKEDKHIKQDGIFDQSESWPEGDALLDAADDTHIMMEENHEMLGCAPGTTKTSEEISKKSTTKSSYGSHVELGRHKDIPTWLGDHLATTPMIVDIIKELKDNVPKGGINILPKVDIDTAIRPVSGDHPITGLQSKIITLNIRIGWQSDANVDVGDNVSAQINNFYNYKILKKYNYLFSGENNQVIKFNLSQNNLYHTATDIDNPNEYKTNQINTHSSASIGPPILPEYMSDITRQLLQYNVDMTAAPRQDRAMEHKTDTKTTPIGGEIRLNSQDEKQTDNRYQVAQWWKEEAKRQQGNLNCDISIIGDPDWLLGRDTISSDHSHLILEAINQELTSDITSFPKPPSEVYKPDAEPESSGDIILDMLVRSELPYIVFVNYLPSPVMFEPWNEDNQQNEIDTMTSGVYMLNRIHHKFNSGTFTQRLLGMRQQDVRTSFVIKQINSL